MAEAIGLGASIVGIASAGITAAAAIFSFATSYRGSSGKLEDLASRVSLSATILEQVGKTITENEHYFKRDEFDEKFGRVTQRCKLDYDALNRAISKSRSSTGHGEPGLAEDTTRLNETTTKKMSPWKKLVWALGGKDAIEELQRSLAESMAQVSMMQAAAQ